MRLFTAACCCLLLGACTLIDVKIAQQGEGLESEGFIEGYATMGWVDTDSLLEIEILTGRNQGSLAMVNLWHFVRIELGLLGASLGVGPFDAGVGLLFYHPRPPRYLGHDDDEVRDVDVHEDVHEDVDLHEHEHVDIALPDAVEDADGP